MANWKKISEGLNSHSAGQWALIAFLYVLTFLFPDANPSVDALDYAAGLKYNFDLFEEHHLLHNLPAYFIYHFSGLKWEALRLMNLLSGIYFLLLLVVFRSLLLVLKYPEKTVGPLILIVGASWGVLRFTCSNEVYILPLAITLWAYIELNRAAERGFPLWRVLLAGSLFSLACLFHQIQVLWFLAIGLSCVINKRKELSFFKLFFFVVPALLVPLTYWLVNIFYFNRGASLSALFNTMFFVWQNPDTQPSFQVKYILIWLVSIVRSFLQLSGYMWFLPKVSLTWLGAYVVLGAYFLFYLWRLPLFYRSAIVRLRRSNLLIPVVLLLFSLVNHGNAEFLVGLPIAIIVSLEIVKIRQLALWDLGWPLLGWNLLFGLVVGSIYKLSPEKQVVSWLAARDNAIIVSERSAEIRAQWYYNFGLNRLPPVLNAPSSFVNELNLLHTIDSLKLAGVAVYTDFPNRLPVSRASFMEIREEPSNFERAAKDTVQAIDLLSGNYYLYRLR